MKINIKNIKVKSICATLFISLFLSCNNSGPEPKELREGQAAMADGTVVDLSKLGKKIEDAVVFADGVKEISTLVKSVIEELPKVIAKKINGSGELTSDTGNKNGPLLAGIFTLILGIETKLTGLEKTSGISNEVKGKVSDAKSKVEAFLVKLKTNHSTLDQDAEIPKAINIKSDGSKGGNELKALNTAVDALLNTANGALAAVMKEFKEPAKAIPAQNN
ncbi:hypothetical protein bcCo53_001548 (plasmid) [Borrelia coriaceae]|nr:Vsp/OspC family lipoprotein [Borrelia coriaceae]UPA17358.1 hypothetical protein bcCo53_001548 [Borrelia coriaceae]